jgi:hypothetical protein
MHKTGNLITGSVGDRSMKGKGKGKELCRGTSRRIMENKGIDHRKGGHFKALLGLSYRAE